MKTQPYDIERIKEAIHRAFIETSIPQINPREQMPKLLKIILDGFQGDEIQYFDTKKNTLEINSEYGEAIFRPAYQAEPMTVELTADSFPCKVRLWNQNKEYFRHGNFLFLKMPETGFYELFIPTLIQSELVGLLNLGFKNNFLKIDERMEESIQLVSSILSNYFERFEIKNQSRIFENAIQQSKDIILITDGDLEYPGPRILYANDAFETMTGYTKKEVIGKSPRIFQGPHTDEKIKALMKETLSQGESFSNTTINYRKDQTEYYVQIDIHPIRDNLGAITNYIAIQRDITNEINREKSFNKRLKYEIALASISQLLLQPYNNKNILYDSLEQIQLFSGVSSASILNHKSGLEMEIFKSYNPVSILNTDQKISIPKPWLNSIQNKIPIISYSFQNNTKSEEEFFLQNLSIHSCLLFPITSDTRGEGNKLLFITENDNDRIWQDEDILLFRTYCHLIGGFLDRMSYLEELFTHRDHLQDLVDEKTRDLEIALEKAKVANKAKSDFLSNMSHELRTPLNSIIGFTKLIRVQDENPDYIKYLDYINKSGTHLLQLINEILDMSKIESGKLEIRSEKIPLIPSLKLAMESMLPQAKKKNIQFKNELLNEEIFILGEEKRLRQIFLNIVSNAVKFSYENTDIITKVEIYRNNPSNNVKVKIMNMGITIPKADLVRIFEKFTQLKSNSNTELQGTGLGLSISKLLTESMGGSIEVESVSEGWTSFFIELPLHIDNKDKYGKI